MDSSLRPADPKQSFPLGGWAFVALTCTRAPVAYGLFSVSGHPYSCAYTWQILPVSFHVSLSLYALVSLCLSPAIGLWPSALHLLRCIAAHALPSADSSFGSLRHSGTSYIPASPNPDCQLKLKQKNPKNQKNPKQQYRHSGSNTNHKLALLPPKLFLSRGQSSVKPQNLIHGTQAWQSPSQSSSTCPFQS